MISSVFSDIFHVISPPFFGWYLSHYPSLIKILPISHHPLTLPTVPLTIPWRSLFNPHSLACAVTPGCILMSGRSWQMGSWPNAQPFKQIHTHNKQDEQVAFAYIGTHRHVYMHTDKQTKPGIWKKVGGGYWERLGRRKQNEKMMQFIS